MFLKSVITAKNKKSLLIDFNKKLKYFFNYSFIDIDALYGLKWRKIYSLLKKTTIKNEFNVSKADIKVIAKFLSETNFNDLSTSNVKKLYNSLFNTSIFKTFKLVINNFSHYLLELKNTLTQIIFYKHQTNLILKNNLEDFFCKFKE